MNKEELIEGLKYQEEKHRNDSILTFGIDISAMCTDALDVLKHCIEIPEDATVGDVMKIMFPEVEIKEGYDLYGNQMMCMHLGEDNDISHMSLSFTPDIWNSQFKING